MKSCLPRIKSKWGLSFSLHTEILTLVSSITLEFSTSWNVSCKPRYTSYEMTRKTLPNTQQWQRTTLRNTHQKTTFYDTSLYTLDIILFWGQFYLKTLQSLLPFLDKKFGMLYFRELQINKLDTLTPKREGYIYIT